VLDVLHEPRSVDQAPAEIYARLLDEKRYLCSERTMYRVLAENAEVRERREQLRHPAYKKPELLATAPNQVWSWDITKLLGPAKWTYLYLYVLLDILPLHRRLDGRPSRECDAREKAHRGGLPATGNRAWPARHPRRPRTVDDVEDYRPPLCRSRRHAEPLAAERLQRQPVLRGQFKTLKYRPGFPDRFGSAQHTRAHCGPFFHWYNGEHRHGGIGLLTPHDVHYGLADQRVAERARVLVAAHAAHPERFPAGVPTPPPVPTAVWINPPTLTSSDVEEAH
jgi:putative transposase